MLCVFFTQSNEKNLEVSKLTADCQIALDSSQKIRLEATIIQVKLLDQLMYSVISVSDRLLYH